MKKIILNTFIFLLVYFILDSCVIMKSSFYHDKSNPCNTVDNPYRNSIECAKWKKEHPREYQRYIKRTTKEPKGS